MSPYRNDPRLPDPSAARFWHRTPAVPLVVLASAAAHVALLAACAFATPKEPPTPRIERVRVLTGAVTSLEGGDPSLVGLRIDGFANADVRAR